ncbi:MAG: 3-hydroxyacyl-ACP dehydratase [Bacteroidota bacterium]
MKLLNDFFKILSIEKSVSKISVAVELNPAHEIFKGHFPGNPVVPGVCMVQMLKEILSHIYKKEFTLQEASQLKFLAILNPTEVQVLNVELSILKEENETFIISGTFQKAELIFLKYKASFTSKTQ